MSAGRWHIYSDRERGILHPPELLTGRLPKAADVSADGNWAEITDKKGVAKVFVRLTGTVKLPSARKAAA